MKPGQVKRFPTGAQPFPPKSDRRPACPSSICLSFCLVLLTSPSGQASDWGYEGTTGTGQPEKVLEEQSAASLTKSLLKPNKSAAPAIKKSGAKLPPAPPALPPDPTRTLVKESAKDAGSGNSIDNIIDKDMQAARCWLQLFQACSKQTLDYTEQKRMEAYVLGRERQGGKAKEEFRSVLSFWPKLINDLRDRPEMEMHYRDLFKALLRLHERSNNEKTRIEGSPYNSDADLISQLLGLERIAVPGEPPFSEDAVDAYADMAVFIYEQQHAGRTIDANDNRTLFAKVVVEKFNRAPTDADRRAMSSFDLAWAKFKIIWFSSSGARQKALLEKLVKAGASSTLTVSKDPLLDLVLSNWPWKTNP